jgi:hypothetical protein
MVATSLAGFMDYTHIGAAVLAEIGESIEFSIVYY